MVIVISDSETEAVLVINGLVAAAEHEERCHAGDQLAARRYRATADTIADQLALIRPDRTG
jgi:hypothetical protein